MSVFSTSSDIIPVPDQRVFVNGSLRTDVWCEALTVGVGAGSCTADVSMPFALFDDDRAGLRDGEIVVSVDGATDFIGFLDVDSATLSGEDVKLRATTITAWLNKIWVGQEQQIPNVEYRLTNPVTGQPTGMTPARILQDIFNKIPGEFGSRIRLGDISTLNSTSENSPPSLAFRNQTYTQAIDSILALYGDVTYRERFSGNSVYLDFFRIQGAGQSSVSVRIGSWRDPIADGVNVHELDINLTSQDAITRVIAYGAPRRFVISCYNYDENPDRVLRKGWEPALEPAVLANPEIAKPNAKGYVPGMEYVFRRWFLPKCLNPFTKTKSLGVRRMPESVDEEGAEYNCQVWNFPSHLVPDEINGGVVGTEQEEPVIVKNSQAELESGYFMLSNCKDGLRVVSYRASEGQKPQIVYAPAKVGITFAIESPNDYLIYDSSADKGSGIRLPFINDGLTEQLVRDDLQYIQMSNGDFAIKSGAGDDLIFSCAIWDEDFTVWRKYTEKAISRDDTPILQRLAGDILRSKNQRHISVNVTLENYSRAYKPGNKLIIFGMRNDPPQGLMITGVSWNLSDPQTMITADNVIPPVTREVNA